MFLWLGSSETFALLALQLALKCCPPTRLRLMQGVYPLIPFCWLLTLATSSNLTSCGRTPIRPDLHVDEVRGRAAKPFSWPWQVALYCECQGLLLDFPGESREIPSRYTCGGAIVAPEWVIVAAHCLMYCDKAFIRAGIYTRTSEYAVFRTNFQISW